MSGTETTSATGLRKRTKVVVSRDRMNASLTVSSPQDGEPPITPDEIHHALADGNVSFGVDESAIERIISEKLFDQPIEIAVGKQMIKGCDAQFEYFFETKPDFSPHQGSDGLMDYRNINFLQNTTVGKLLSRRTPPTKGEDGTGVDGKEINAPNGKDIRFSCGAGCAVSEDGLELKATAEGAIVYKNGHISVSDIMSINGDIDFNVGNLDCAGSLKISGEVISGFKITAGGNLEVGGNVEDATVRADGNVIIKGGFFGSGEGSLTAGADLVIKYAENQKIAAGGDITVGGELLNCRVNSQGNVFVAGQGGKLIGGDVTADQIIESAVIGSDAATPTFLSVAVNTELMQEYREVCSEIERVMADFERVKGTLHGLYRLQLDRKLDPKKEQVLAKLERFNKDAPAEIEALNQRKMELEAELEQTKDARIVVREKIYPGVEMRFGLLKRQIDEEMGACAFVVEGRQIVRTEKVDPKKRA